MTNDPLADHSAYIEASDDESVSLGSGVFAQLRRSNEGVNAPPARPETYVIANAHTVYQKPNQDDGNPQTWPKITGWVRGTAYHEDLAFRCEVVDGVGYEPKSRSGAPEWGGARNDWVLLRIYLDDLERSPEPVRKWRSSSLGRSWGVTLYGYPQGSDSFNNGVVHPTLGEIGRLHTNDNATVKLQGGESRPGMSGGPYFDFLGRFAGIHQSRNDTTMQRTLILSTHLRDRLHEAGYEVIEQQHDRWETIRATKGWAVQHPAWTITTILMAIAAFVLAIMMLLAPTVVQADSVAQFFARNSMAIADREFVDGEVRVQGTATIVDANDFHYVVKWPLPAGALTEEQLAKIGSIEIEPTDGMPEQTLPRGTRIEFEGTAIKFRDYWGLLLNDAEVVRATTP